ncbi:MAG: hypothetical protein IPP14_02710 [Planctomycetes bacterium]|nr:hypothetical protein [Planctomycetota bacterium]
MKRNRFLVAAGLAALGFAFAACGPAGNSAGNAPANAPTNNAPATNAPAENAPKDTPPAAFDVAKERDALVDASWGYLKKMYNGNDKSMDENKVGIPGGWGPGSTNIPYTAMVLYGIYGTKVWDANNDMVKDSVKFLVESQDPATGSWSYAPLNLMPKAKGVRAVYITAILLELFTDLNADGPWKGKLGEAVAKARDYLVQSQVGNAAGPAPDYSKEKVGYGGWAYSKEEIDSAVKAKGKPASNMSTSAFAVDALHKCGLKEDDPVWEAALTFFKRNQNAGEVQSEGFEAMYNGKKVKMAVKGEPGYGGSIYSEETSKAGVTENADGTVTLASYGTMTYNLLRSYIFCGMKKDSLPVTLAWGWITRNYTVEHVPGYQSEEKNTQGLYYYYVSMAKTLYVMGKDTVEEADRGTKHNWREDLVKALKSRQKAEGNWVNTNKEWQEDSPVLCTSYALSALRHTR